MATPLCNCCKVRRGRLRNTGTNTNPSWRVLCGPCSKDPALRYADCKHGHPEPSTQIELLHGTATPVYRPEEGAGDA